MRTGVSTKHYTYIQDGTTTIRIPDITRENCIYQPMIIFAVLLLLTIRKAYYDSQVEGEEAEAIEAPTTAMIDDESPED